MIEESFRQDYRFKLSLYKAFHQLINKKFVSDNTSFVNKSSELIARYCDLTVKKATENDGGLRFEEVLNNVSAWYLLNLKQWNKTK